MRTITPLSYRVRGIGSRSAALFDVAEIQRRLREGTGGYEILHRPPALEIGVYVLVAPLPDHHSPHQHDEVYAGSAPGSPAPRAEPARHLLPSEPTDRG